MHRCKALLSINIGNYLKKRRENIMFGVKEKVRDKQGRNEDSKMHPYPSEKYEN